MEATSSSESAQPACTSGRRCGTRWLNVVQGIRRSLDVHLKSYYKIDAAFVSSLRHARATDKLGALARGLPDTGLVDFCCVTVVHPGRGTFGTVALSGPGAELYPPSLSDSASRWPSSCGGNVFNRSVFQVADSNWAVEDVVSSRAPWYYDCASATNGYGLPQEAGWLRRVGMRSVLALPCLHEGEVWGVLLLANKQKTLDHLLLRKLEELCARATPTVADAVAEQQHLLASSQHAGRYESVNDFAHAVLGEMLNLDRAVATSIHASGSGHVSGVLNASAARQQQRQASMASAGSSKGSRKQASNSSGRFDAAAAVAAAAAAGFTWTAHTPASQASAAPVLHHAPLAAPLKPSSGHSNQQNVPPHVASVDAFDSFLTALTAAPADARSDSAPRLASVTDSAPVVVAATPAATPTIALTPAATAPAAGAGSVPHATPLASYRHATQYGMAPSACPAAAAATCPRPPRRAGSSSGNTGHSRSTRSLSCMELSCSGCGPVSSDGGHGPMGLLPGEMAPAACPGSSSARSHPLPPDSPASSIASAAPALECDAACARRVSSEDGCGAMDMCYMINSASTTRSVKAAAGLSCQYANGFGYGVLLDAGGSSRLDSRTMLRCMPLECSASAAASSGGSCRTQAATDTRHSCGSADGATATTCTGTGTGMAALYGSGGGSSVAGRWSRDSAAAAAAVWSHEASDAFAAALRYTSVAMQLAPRLPAPPASRQGALYDIQESGPVPASTPSSPRAGSGCGSRVSGSGSEDCGLAVVGAAGSTFFSGMRCEVAAGHVGKLAEAQWGRGAC